MPRQARGEYLDPHTVQVIHGVQRCVRRAYLCGRDRGSRKSFDHRRGWIRDRMELLSSIFGIDCLTYTVLSNHLHVVLRSRPDVVATWCDEEVGRRWLRLFPQRRLEDGSPAEPTDAELQTVTGTAERVGVLRSRLSDVSWWMRCLAENIARRANHEEQCSGRFWEGRFKAQLLLDEASLLACAAYVDLNPVRAALANSPEESEFTGARDRIADLQDQDTETLPSQQAGHSVRQCVTPQRTTHSWERSPERKRSGWMSPLEIREASDDSGPAASSCGRRASVKGFLSLSLPQYLELLDWTGRQIHAQKRGRIPAKLAPILNRIGINSSEWCDLVVKFGKLFKRAAGSVEQLSSEASRRGQRYLQAPGAGLLSAAAD